MNNTKVNSNDLITLNISCLEVVSVVKTDIFKYGNRYDTTVTYYISPTDKSSKIIPLEGNYEIKVYSIVKDKFGKEIKRDLVYTKDKKLIGPSRLNIFDNKGYKLSYNWDEINPKGWFKDINSKTKTYDNYGKMIVTFTDKNNNKIISKEVNCKIRDPNIDFLE
ncbi:MAG: hypothetical protein WCF78_00775 [archaeon]